MGPANSTTDQAVAKLFELKHVDAKYGRFLVPPADIYVGRSLDVYGEWCEKEVRLFRQIVKPGGVVLEVGANIGSHTVPLAQMVGPGGRVMAVEMQPFLAQVLSANLLNNGLIHANVLNAGAAQEAEWVKINVIDYGHAFNWGGVSLPFLKGNANINIAQAVPVLALDDLVVLPQLDFLKLDVEGLEAAVLAGAAGLITQFEPVIYLECDKAAETDGILEVLKGFGYDAFWHISPLFNADNFRQMPDDVFDNAACVNMLAVPPGKPVSGLRPVEGAESHPRFGVA